MIHQETEDDQHSFDDQPASEDWPTDWTGHTPTAAYGYLPASPPVPAQDQWQLKETSSYGKGSTGLTASFFDIQSNVQLLDKCKTLSIQVVDCNKHPWYYRRYTKSDMPGKYFEHVQSRCEPTKIPVNTTQISANKNMSLPNNTYGITTNVGANTPQDNMHEAASNTKAMTTKSTKSILNRVYKNDLAYEYKKKMACSQVNLSKIDLKHNTGLVGVKIAGAFEFQKLLVNSRKRGSSRALPSDTVSISVKNDIHDSNFAAASKALGNLGTTITPVPNNKNQCEISDNSATNKDTYQCSVPCAVSKPGPKFSKRPVVQKKDAPILVPNQNDVTEKFKNDSMSLVSSNHERSEIFSKKILNKTYEHKDPLQSVSHYSGAKPGSTLPKKSHTENKYSIFLKPQKNEICDEVHDLKENSTSCSNAFFYNLPKHVEMKKVTKPPKTKKGILNPTQEPLRSYTNNEEPLSQINENQNKVESIERTSEDTSRSKSPVFPLKKNIEILTTNKANDVIITSHKVTYVKNWPKATQNHKQPSVRIPNVLTVNKCINPVTSSNNYVETLSQQPISSEKNNSNDLISNKNILHNRTEVPAKTIERKVTTTSTSDENDLISSKETIVTNSQTARPISEINTNEINISPTNSTGMQNKNNNNIDMKMNLIKNEINQRLIAWCQQNLPQFAPKARDKQRNVSKPLKIPPVSTFTPSSNIPIQTHISNRPEPNRDTLKYATNAFLSQNIDNKHFSKQRVPAIPENCKFDGIINNFADHTNAYSVNSSRYLFNVGNPNMCYPSWNPSFPFPYPPYMTPPPLIQPPPNVPLKDPNANSRQKNGKNSVKKDSNNFSKNSEIDNDIIICNEKNSIEPSQVQSRSSAAQGNEQTDVPSLGQNIEPLANKAEILTSYNIQSTVPDNKRQKDTLLEKKIKNDNPNKIAIKPIGKTWKTKICENRTIDNKIKKTTSGNKTIDQKINKNDTLPPLSGKIDDVVQTSTNDILVKSKPCPLSMKNKTFTFGEKNNSNPSQQKIPTQSTSSERIGGYSDPIFPKLTFESLRTQNLEASLRQALKDTSTIDTQTGNLLQMLAHKRTSDPGETDTNTRSHLDKQDATETTVKRKISYEDYKNRVSGTVDSNVESEIKKKFPRKSDNSSKSVKFSDIVNLTVEHEI